MAVKSTLFKVEGLAAGAEALERLTSLFCIVVTAGCWRHTDTCLLVFTMGDISSGKIFHECPTGCLN